MYFFECSSVPAVERYEASACGRRQARLADVVLIRRIRDGSKNGCNHNDYQQLDKREALLVFHCIYVVNN